VFRRCRSHLTTIFCFSIWLCFWNNIASDNRLLLRLQLFP